MTARSKPARGECPGCHCRKRVTVDGIMYSHRCGDDYCDGVGWRAVDGTIVETPAAPRVVAAGEFEALRAELRANLEAAAESYVPPVEPSPVTWWDFWWDRHGWDVVAAGYVVASFLAGWFLRGYGMPW